MAETNYNPDELRSGANACLTALRKMETVSEIRNHPDQTWEQHWQHLKEMSDVLVEASGITDSRGVGFVSALAEYIEIVNSSGIPNLDAGGWTPKATMTESDFAAYREKSETA